MPQPKHRPKATIFIILTLVIGLVAGLFWYLQERQIREGHAYAGIPQAQGLSIQNFARILRNEGFMLGYSEFRQNPLWVTYQLKDSQGRRVGKRPKNFQPDYRTLSRTEQQDYAHSGYDRGHMAPNYAIARQYGRQAQLDSFLMSNITPQKQRLNQKLWQRLEEVEINYFTRWFGQVWIITGPIFDDQATYLPSGIEIPDAFYKVFAIPGDRPRLLAFIMPQEVDGHEPLDRFLTSVDEIEELTGLDLFHRLEDGLEEQLESAIDTTEWRLEEVARLPPRY